MNPLLLRDGLRAAQKGWAKFNDYREKKADEAYDALQDAAQAALDKGQELYESAADADVVQRGSAVSQQAAKRLEKAKKDAKKQAAEWRDTAEKNAKKSGKQLRKEAKKRSKDAKKSTKQLRKEAKKRSKDAKKSAKDLKKQLRGEKSCKGKTFGVITAVVAALAAIGVAVYYFLFRERTEVGTQPPRVEDHAAPAPESRLVYSTETPEPSTPVADTSVEDIPSGTKDLDAAAKRFDEQVEDSMNPEIHNEDVGVFDNNAEVDSFTDPRSDSVQASELLEAEIEAKYGKKDND